jgi:hypothetical protein
MGPVATAVLSGCLQALKWLLWCVAVLLLILVIVQYFRGDAAAKPVANLLTMAAFAGAGIIAHWVAGKISGQ